MVLARSLLIAAVLSAVSACGGGGGGGDSSSGGANSDTWTAGVFKPASDFDAECAAPRSGNDPDGRPWPDVQGRAVDENNWLRSWSHDLYLWYRELPDMNPANFAVPAYFDILKTSAVTASGQPKDKFHFTFPTDEWLALSQSGVVVGYGLQWAVVSPTPPRDIVVAYTDPGTPAASAPANMSRGEQVRQVDGEDVDVDTQAGVDILNAALFPAAAGESHTFVIQELAGGTRTVTLTSGSFTSTPVQNVHTIATASGAVGYMLFNDHIATAESQLVDAINTLKAANVTDLVIDLRYNGGGFLSIASELAFMVAGTATAGKTFEQLQFNDQHPTTDPVTGDPLTPVLFHNTAQGFSVPSGQALPTLNLARVFVLTGPGTCSASESIINSLRGIDVEVIQIGSTTCGKPYGFYPADNCGTTYFSIQFRGVNAKDFGDYTDGFSPANTAGTLGEPLPGCSVADDFTHALGNANETRLAVALDYRVSSTCSVPPSGFARSNSSAAAQNALAAVDGVVYKSPWHENRMFRRPGPP